VQAKEEADSEESKAFLKVIHFIYHCFTYGSLLLALLYHVHPFPLSFSQHLLLLEICESLHFLSHIAQTIVFVSIERINDESLYFAQDASVPQKTRIQVVDQHDCCKCYNNYYIQDDRSGAQSQSETLHRERNPTDRLRYLPVER
jgi:hypothetical protein